MLFSGANCEGETISSQFLLSSGWCDTFFPNLLTVLIHNHFGHWNLVQYNSKLQSITQCKVHLLFCLLDLCCHGEKGVVSPLHTSLAISGIGTGTGWARGAPSSFLKTEPRYPPQVRLPLWPCSTGRQCEVTPKCLAWATSPGAL